MAVKIMPISDLRRRTSDVVEAVQSEGDVYITQHGRPIMVMVEYSRYEQLLGQVKSPEVLSPVGTYTDYLAGLHQEVWEGVDTDAYLQRERDAWEPSTPR